MEAWSEAQGPQPEPAPRVLTLAGKWPADGMASHVAPVCKPAQGFSSTGQRQADASVHASARAVWAGSQPQPLLWPESLGSRQLARVNTAAAVHPSSVMRVQNTELGFLKNWSSSLPHPPHPIDLDTFYRPRTPPPSAL